MVKFAIAFPLMFITICSAGGDEMKLRGSLLTGVQGILSLSLSDGTLSRIFIDSKISVHQISKIDEERLLLSILSLVKADKPLEIAIYNMPSKKLDYILVGGEAVYMPRYEKIVFYDNWRRLAISDTEAKSIQFIERDPVVYPFPVVPVSDSEFVFENERSGAHEIWKYSFESGEAVELSALSDCSLNNAVWRSATKELLCSEIRPDGSFTGRYFMSDLRGKNRRHVSFGRGEFWPVIYFDDIDSLVIQERRASLLRGEFHPVHLYRFVDGSKTRITDDAMLSIRVAHVID